MDMSLHATQGNRASINDSGSYARFDFESSIFAALTREWEHVTTTPDAVTELAQWRTRRPELSAVDTFYDLDPMMGRTEPDALFSALLELHQEGSQLAGRALLHLMRFKLSSMSRYGRADGYLMERQYHERGAMTVHAFMEVIATFRGTGRSVPGSLALRTLKLITDKSVHETEFPTDSDLLHTQCDSAPASVVGHVADPTDISVQSVLDWAVRSQTLSAFDRTLIERAYLTDEGTDLEALADEFDLSYAAMRKRLSRSISRIRDAVCTDIGAGFEPKKRNHIHHRTPTSAPLAS